MILLIAVLEKRCGIPFYNQDVYLNAMGGIRLAEPSIDLAVCAALASGFKNVAVDKYTAVFGEVGMTGESARRDLRRKARERVHQNGI